jgi:hypothetical protein
MRRGACLDRELRVGGYGSERDRSSEQNNGGIARHVEYPVA